jgi:hypothetical protein
LAGKEKKRAADSNCFATFNRGVRLKDTKRVYGTNGKKTEKSGSGWIPFCIPFVPFHSVCSVLSSENVPQVV